MSKQCVAVLWSGGAEFGSTVTSRRTADSDNMAGVFLLAFIAGVLLEAHGLPVEDNAGNSPMGERRWIEEAAKCQGCENV